MTPTTVVEKAAEAAVVVSTPVVYSVAGMTFFGITLEDWVLVGTAVLLAFNILFAGLKLRDLLRRKSDVD